MLFAFAKIGLVSSCMLLLPSWHLPHESPCKVPLVAMLGRANQKASVWYVPYTTSSNFVSIWMSNLEFVKFEFVVGKDKSIYDLH